jgi:hypothetical protein
MWTRPRIYIGPEQIEPGVQRAVQALAPDVVCIRFSLEEDWTGDPSVFFRVVLSKAASREKRLGETTRRISDMITNEVKPLELGLNYYYNFRSLSEADRDPAWA